MKTAKLVPVAFEVPCPYCKECAPSPGGSLFWTQAEIVEGAELKCFNCKHVFVVPRLPGKRPMKQQLVLSRRPHE